MDQPSAPEYVRIPFDVMESRFESVLLARGFTEETAKTCAVIFAENSQDGVYTHGVNRFPRFVTYVQDGHVNPSTSAIFKSRSGSIEQWDGQMGPGPVNAVLCTDRAIAIAGEQGMGCVALSNTNHWMRGGTYGWHAAKKGYVFVGWTNTTANMPTWGAVDVKLGNNPLVLAVPYKDQAIVLDMAMSQYSYGAVDFYKQKGQQLPVPGGFSIDGTLTTDPEEILQSQRILPIGYWKGAGLSLVLDILAAILSGGSSVSDISRRSAESGLSQVFIAIKLSGLNNHRAIAKTIHDILIDYHQSTPDKSSAILFPGERVMAVREENMLKGIPVLKSVWQSIMSL
ncbi:MAG: 3-dehydro-L-gulonate 2-dehydrogenase [Chryseolinea sp.]